MKKNKTNPNYKSKNHSKYLLTYHFIFVCKYRKKLLIKYGEIVKECCYDDFNMIINYNIGHYNESKSIKTIISQSFVMWYDGFTQSLNILNGSYENIRYINLKDFLNHFKIPLVDIV